MSASSEKKSIWSRIFGLFKGPQARQWPVAAHLQSMTPADAALLMGAGSMPPRADKLDPEIAIDHSATLAANVPWPLMRSTGSFHFDFAKTDKALAARVAALAPEDEVALTAIAGVPQAVPSSQPARNFAAQMAVVARINQPASRTEKNRKTKAAAKVVAKKSGAVSAKSKPIKTKIAKAKPIGKKSQPAHAKTLHDMQVRPQAVIIDLAAVKKQRRGVLHKRAA